MPFSQEEPQDRAFLEQAIALSRRALDDGGKGPFGAVVVVDGEVVGAGANSVVERNDPTAHAEVMALRSAGETLGRHLMEDAVLYASSEPCPMCLVACYWAGIPRVVYAANSRDAAVNGFEDLQFYRELTLPNAERTLLDEVPVGGDLHADAAGTLAQWAAQLPETVVPKL
ncbi:nucleoside deaminase [Streptomyces sp. NBC_01197]|uniref:nucleoside deaminase n=1 Tax=Streptomyces sp. NBC_01197 TaxID=2903768 RepID=UPI002E11AC23|nr:nucleoside deaminase [Streptomyces sp. NBC_01197]